MPRRSFTTSSGSSSGRRGCPRAATLILAFTYVYIYIYIYEIISLSLSLYIYIYIVIHMFYYSLLVSLSLLSYYTALYHTIL